MITITRFKDFFNKKKTEIVKVKKDFNIDEFNEWFKTGFDGYDGRKGAPGIFLRLDKFSRYCVEDYLKYIGQEPTSEEIQYYYDIVRNDWKNRLD